MSDHNQDRVSMDPAVQDGRTRAGRAAAAAAAEGAQRTPTRRPGDRQPFGAAEQQLAYPPIDGFRLYWFNDVPGRVERAKLAGYEHVQENGQPVARNVGRGEGGGGIKAYLMKIPLEWYEEDSRAAQSLRDDNLRAIKEGRYGAATGQNQYVPSSGIKIDERR